VFVDFFIERPVFATVCALLIVLGGAIAIPAVGTGIAGFPMEDCATVMGRALSGALAEGWQPEEVRFVLFGDAARRAFETSFRNAFKG
jgi:O-acetyl-ADP-ribose deacetylase (regulator of RNase III)